MKQMMFCLAAVAGIILSGCNDPKILKTIPVSEPNLNSVMDGVYRGTYTLELPSGYFIGNRTAVVDVVISNHRYQKIEIINEMKVVSKTNFRPLLDSIIREQKLNVDAVSGASFTRKAVIKAIEKALTKE